METPTPQSLPTEQPTGELPPQPPLTPASSPAKKWVSIGIAVLIVLVLLGVAAMLYWRARDTGLDETALEEPGAGGTLPLSDPLTSTSPLPELLTETSSSDSPIVNTLTEIDTLESSLNALGSDTEL